MRKLTEPIFEIDLNQHGLRSVLAELIIRDRGFNMRFWVVFRPFLGRNIVCKRLPSSQKVSWKHLYPFFIKKYLPIHFYGKFNVDKEVA